MDTFQDQRHWKLVCHEHPRHGLFTACHPASACWWAELNLCGICGGPASRWAAAGTVAVKGFSVGDLCGVLVCLGYVLGWLQGGLGAEAGNLEDSSGVIRGSGNWGCVSETWKGTALVVCTAISE